MLPFHLHVCVYVENCHKSHRVAEAGGHHWRYPHPTAPLKQGQPEPGALACPHLNLGSAKEGRRLHNLSGQRVAKFDQIIALFVRMLFSVLSSIPV